MKDEEYIPRDCNTYHVIVIHTSWLSQGWINSVSCSNWYFFVCYFMNCDKSTIYLRRSSRFCQFNLRVNHFELIDFAFIVEIPGRPSTLMWFSNWRLICLFLTKVELMLRLKSLLWTFYGRHHDLVDRYGISGTNDHTQVCSKRKRSACSSIFGSD